MINRPHGLFYESPENRRTTICLYPTPLIFAEPDWDIGHPACEAVFEWGSDLCAEMKERFPSTSFVASTGIHDRISPRIYIEIVISGYDSREAADWLRDRSSELRQSIAAGCARIARR